MDKRTKYILITIIAMLVIIITGTFSWLTYRSKKTALVFTVGDMNRGYITLSPYQLDAEIDPTLAYTSNDYVTITANNQNNPKPLKYSLFYEIEEIDNDLISNDFKYTVLRSNDGTNYTEYKTGNFSTASNNSTLLISNEILPVDGTYYYKVYLWLDGTNNQNNINDATFKGNLKADILGKNISYLSDLSNTSSYFKQTEYKTKIYNVYFVFEDTVPNNAITIAGLNQNYYDLSLDQDESIKGWLIQTDTDKYDLYIGSKNKIYANTLSYLFHGMQSIESISFYNLDTSATTDMSYMFYNCRGLLSLDVTNFDTSSVVNMERMFYYCNKLTNLDVTHFNTSNVINMNGLFNQCSGLTAIDVTHFNTSKVENMRYMFSNCSSLTSLDVTHFNTQNVTNMMAMFGGCSGLSSLDLSNFNTSNVENMALMFGDCSNLTSINFGNNFDTAKVVGTIATAGNGMYEMFRSCTSLSSLDLSSFNFSNVRNMIGMFRECSNLVSIDFGNSGLSTNNSVTTMMMFQNCSSLVTLDLSGFTNVLATVGNNPSLMADYMFKNCTSLRTIYVSDRWVPYGNTIDVEVFMGCTNLVGGNGTQYDANHIDGTYARVDTAGSPGYFTYKAYTPPSS